LSRRLQKSLRSSSERGSAVIDFVLVGVPLVLLAVTLLSISISNYAVAVMRDIAVESARYAALADKSAAEGCKKATELLNNAFASNLANGVFCVSGADLDGEQIGVKIKMPFPIIGLIASSLSIEVQSSAPIEN
jgi:Flp pilus assembly protein TadG